jgi:hypothetical protein
MNCQQATDLMQRSLDHDLTEAEQQVMVSHFHRCPACSSFFERLQMVSEELEALPPVTPPYSIVNSIMGRLAYPDPIPADNEHAVEKEKFLSPVPVEKEKRRFRPVWFVYGGTAAAALLLGAFLYQSGGLIGGGAKSSGSADLAAKTTAKQAAGATNGTADGANPGATKKMEQSSTATDPNSTMKDALPPAADIANQTTSNQAETSRKKNLSGGTGANAGSGSKPRHLTSDDKGSVAQSTGISSGNDKTAGTPPQAAGTAATGQIIEPAKGDADQKGTPGGTPEATDPGLAYGGIAGSQQTLTSVNGKYTASVVGQRVTIRSANKNIAMVSQYRWNDNDKVGLTIWYNDYQLMYTVQKGDGTQSRYVMDLLTNSEFER